MNSNAATPASVRSPSRRRWPRRLLAFLLIVLGLPTAYYLYSTSTLRNEIARVLAETDALDPRWRFADMEVDRKPISDADSAQQISKVISLLGKGRGRTPSSQKDYGQVFDNLQPTAQFNEQQIALLREVFETSAESLAEARKLQDMPHGRFAIGWDNTQMLVLLPHCQDVRTIADLLSHDAWLKAQFGDFDGAVAACLAHANAGKALADDFCLVSLMVRNSNTQLLIDTVERVLAQGQPNDAALRRLQDCLHAERAELAGQWLQAVRGERAYFHRFHEPLLNGKTRWLQMAENLRMRVHFEDHLTHYFPALLTRDFPSHLRHRNELVAAAGLPLHEQLDRFSELDKEIDRRDERKVMLAEVLPLLPPELWRCCRSVVWGNAFLASAEAAIACERFRLTHDAWPRSLAELVEAKLLDAVPTDPFDGGHLRFVRRKDGVTIYSVGIDKQDDGGAVDRQRGMAVDGGFRLWDVGERRQAPRPPVALEP